MMKHILSLFLFSAAAVAGFYPVNRGMINQGTVGTVAGSTVTFVATSNQVYIAEGGTSGSFYKFPDARNLPKDWWYTIINNSSGSVTASDNLNASIAVITTGREAYFHLTDSTTQAGTWKYNSPAAIGNIITDHGGLTGLADDDHTQYHNDTRGDARYYQKTEHINAGAGVPDAGKPIVLNASGVVDSTLLPGGGGLTGFGQIDFGSPNLNGGKVSGSELILQSATPGYPGLVSNSAQTITGAKTFTDALAASSTITATGLITGNGGITSANITPSNIAVGAAAFVTASGRLAGDASSFFWDAENRNLNVYGGAGNGTVSGSLNVKAKSDSLGAHLQLEGTGTGGNRYLYINQRENGDMFFYNPGLNRVLFDYNAAVNAMTIGQSGGEYQFNVQASDSNTTLGTITMGSGLGVRNPDATNGNFSILGFQGSASNRNPDSAIYGVHDLHSGASSSGSLEFHTRNAGTLARAARISPTKILTLDGYAAGCLETNASGVVTASACSSGSGGTPTSIGTIDSQAKSANGLVTSSTVLYAQTADASFPGMVSTSTQTFAGDKTFNGTVNLNTVTASRFLFGSASKNVTSSLVNLADTTNHITGTLAVGNGGLGITSTPTNGQIPIGNGTNYVAATITAGSNITVTNSAGGITINSIAGGSGSSPQCQLVSDSNNGFGSTNTAVRRFINQRWSTGSCMTVSDSVALGEIVTINTSGVYAITWHDEASGGSGIVGIVVNGTNPTGNVRTSTYAQGVRALNVATSTASSPAHVSWTGYLNAGDYVWFQSSVSGLDNTGLGAQAMFTITQITQ